MFNATYGAGFRAGMCVAGEDSCPFEARQFISRAMWNAGYYDGVAKRLTQDMKRGV